MPSRRQPSWCSDQEILRRRGKPLARGETLTLTLTPGAPCGLRLARLQSLASDHHDRDQAVEPEETKRIEAA